MLTDIGFIILLVFFLYVYAVINKKMVNTAVCHCKRSIFLSIEIQVEKIIKIALNKKACDLTAALFVIICFLP